MLSLTFLAAILAIADAAAVVQRRDQIPKPAPTSAFFYTAPDAQGKSQP
jgi:hypothetical protein